VDGPPVSYPIRPDIVDCFKREGRERIAELVGEMRDSIPNYQAPSVSGSTGYTYQDVQRAADAQRAAEQRAADAQRIIDARRAAEQKEAEAQRAIERAAEETRRQIQVEAAREKLVARLKELGSQLIT